nr:MAG TPA: hypothetical protein [Caudoviricetes sp.]
MIFNPIIVGSSGGGGTEQQETADLYIELSARIIAGTNYIKMKKPNGNTQSLALGSAVDTRVTYHLFVYQYGTYQFEQDNGKEEGINTGSVTFTKGGPTTQRLRL